MAMADGKPVIRRGPMLKAVQEAARNSRLALSRPCSRRAQALGYDAVAIMEILANEVTLEDVHKCEPDDNPERNCHVMVFLKKLEDESQEIYIKVALILPDLKDGTVISFHL